MEKSFELLKENSVFAMITSNTFLNNKDFFHLRKKLLLDSTILSIANLDETIFESAQVDVAIFLFKTTKSTNSEIRIYPNKEKFLQGNFELTPQKQFNNESLLYEFKLNCTKTDFEIIDEIFIDKIPLGEVLSLPRGIELGSNSDLIETNPTKSNSKLLVGKDIKKYQINFDNRYIVFVNNDKSNFKDKEIYMQDKILIQRIRNLSLSERIIATIDNEKHLCTNTLRIGLLKNQSFSLKYILATINSSIINYVFLKYFLNKDIYSYQLEQIPVAKTDLQEHFISLVDYLLYLNKKKSEQVFTHTSNERIASNIEEVLNMMVYELYFDEHMKENGIDVLQFIDEKLKTQPEKSIAKQIEDFYLWYQKPENPIRQRMLLVETRSKDKIALINKSIQH